MSFTWTEEDYEKYKRRLQGPTKPPAPKPPAPKPPADRSKAAGRKAAGRKALTPPTPRSGKQNQRKSSTADLKKRLAY